MESELEWKSCWKIDFLQIKFLTKLIIVLRIHDILCLRSKSNKSLIKCYLKLLLKKLFNVLQFRYVNIKGNQMND